MFLALLELRLSSFLPISHFGIGVFTLCHHILALKKYALKIKQLPGILEETLSFGISWDYTAQETLEVRLNAFGIFS